MFYLNASSTDFENTHEFNPSDLAYPEVLQQRSDGIEFENQLKHLVNAPPNAQVIFNSGATESIANCIFWAKSYFPSGTIWGTTFDHASVKMNCDNIGMKYTQKGMPSDCAALFITQVNPKTGEIFNVTNIAQKMLSMHYLIDDTTTYIPEYKLEKDVIKSSTSTRDVLMYPPLMFLDASQSIGKIPIDMEKWNLNAVFFSLHKLGGKIGNGVLIISDNKRAPFKPLIAGLQQKGLRGGTYSLENILSFSKSQSQCLTQVLTGGGLSVSSREHVWKKTFEYLKSKGLDVYEPKREHLYNTFLINIHKACPITCINRLALQDIYVGAISACSNEKQDSTTDNFIRISFKSESDIDNDVINTIVDEIKGMETPHEEYESNK